MKRRTMVTHEFVEHIPDQLEEGVVYVSIPYATVAHACCCGCGQEVITPLSPTDWRLIFDGISVSLDPSIGNWSFRCRSHYFISGDRVQWAGQFTQDEIKTVRDHDRRAKANYFADKDSTSSNKAKPDPGKPQRGFWRNLGRWFNILV